MALNMPSDASRRWLDDSGIWSCRIKLPTTSSSSNAHAHAHAESSRTAASPSAHTSNVMAPADPKLMDIPIETTSPSSRRNQGKLVEVIQSMAAFGDAMDLDLPTNPDAQATVTDFLDFTEYLPADMVRSLTLIGNLDSTYSKASLEVNHLTKIYGQLPSLPAESRPDPTKLRADISQNLAEAVSARTASYAEACRMVDNVERHYNRIKNIHAKLQSIADNYPTSRESSPAPKPKSPVLNRPKITLRVGGPSDRRRVRKHRAPRITVPGEVLAPYELDYESYGSESDGSSEQQFETARQTPARSLPPPAGGRIRLTVPKRDRTRDRPKDRPREKAPKPPREIRPEGFGTNVHSQLAGISTSNALRLLEAPPSDAKPGSQHLPWLALSDYELGLLRKKMKKNAVWSPSDVMINRELKLRGRGMEAYKLAVEAANEKGETIETPPQLSGQTVPEKGALSVEAATKSLEQETPVVNRGMKLNESKKLKKETERKEQVEAANNGLDDASRKVAKSLSMRMANLFENTSIPIPAKDDKKGMAKTPSKTLARKRKRESDPVEEGGEKLANGIELATKPTRPLLKRSKTETPVPVPQPIAAKASTPTLSEAAPSVASEVNSVPSTVTPVPAPLPVLAPAPPKEPTSVEASQPGTPNPVLPFVLSSPKKSSTPILPPVKDAKKLIKKEMKRIEVPTATSERPRRGDSAAHTPITPAPVINPLTSAPPVVPVPAEVLPAKRPTSSRSKAASIDRELPVTSAGVDRPRRASTARNTPAPEPRQPSKRAKRPAPGVVTKGSEDSTAVSHTKRSAATRKKAGPKKEKREGQRESSAAQEALVEVDSEGNVIDPHEPRYCLCNRVSFGTMIGCENADVNESSSSTFKTPSHEYHSHPSSSEASNNSSKAKKSAKNAHDSRTHSKTMQYPRNNKESKANIQAMVAKCEKEWFHLECVGLTDIPPRTTKWYCPTCRKAFGIGEKGEINARGKKK